MLKAIGISGSAFVPCGTTLLLVCMQKSPQDIFLLDPDRNEKFFVAQYKELDFYREEKKICLFDEPIEVNNQDKALYLNDGFLKAFKESSHKDYPCPNNLKKRNVKGSESIQIRIGTAEALKENRDQAGRMILTELENIETDHLNYDPISQSVEYLHALEKLEKLARLGATCVGGLSEELFWQFHIRIGMVALLREKTTDLLKRIHAFEVKPFRSLSFDDYLETVQRFEWMLSLENEGFEQLKSNDESDIVKGIMKISVLARISYNINNKTLEILKRFQNHASKAIAMQAKHFLSIAKKAPTLAIMQPQ